MPAGRPSTFSEEKADEICERLINGESLRAICKDDHMPSAVTVFKWLDKHEGFANRYARAKEEQAEMFADEIAAIADETPELEPIRDAQGNIVEMRMHSAYVAYQKNRIDARKWVAAKLKPKKYGERIEHQVNAKVTHAQMTDEELEAIATASRG